MPRDLAKALIEMGHVYTRADARQAGVASLLTLPGLSLRLPEEQRQALDQVIRTHSIGKLDEEAALRAAREARQAGHGEEHQQAAADKVRRTLEAERKEREIERIAMKERLGRKPFERVLWVKEPPVGAPVAEVAAAALVRGTMRKAGPELSRCT